MLAFEISLNGRKICTAGIGEAGVLTSIVTWHLAEGVGRRKGAEDLEVHVGGLVSRTNQHLRWLNRPLRRGDALSVRIVDVNEVDKPKKSRRESAAQRRRRQEAYVRKMAREFGWKIKTT